MRFHLIDRIDEFEPNRSVRARKLTSRSGDRWRDLGRGPELPAPLVLEALCQAGSWLVIGSTAGRLRATLLSVDGVRFGGPVRPGDELVTEGTVESIGEEVAVLSGTASVGGEVVMTADTILCALLPAERLESAEDTDRMWRRLTGGAR